MRKFDGHYCRKYGSEKTKADENAETAAKDFIPLEEFTVIIRETPKDKIANDEAEKEE